LTPVIASGLYLLRLEALDEDGRRFVKTEKMLLIR